MTAITKEKTQVEDMMRRALLILSCEVSSVLKRIVKTMVNTFPRRIKKEEEVASVTGKVSSTEVSLKKKGDKLS